MTAIRSRLPSLLAATLGLALTLALPLAARAAARSCECYGTGDVNADGRYTAGDSQLAFAIALGALTPTPDEFCRADCTGNGAITAADAQRIFATVLGQGACPYALADGRCCENAQHCASGHCQNGYCCAAGECCTSDADCLGTCDLETHQCIFTWGPASFVNSLYLPYNEGDEPCCFDFTGDGEIDNGVANIIAMLGGMIGGDINEEIRFAIESGNLVDLLEFIGVADWADTPSFTLNSYTGFDAYGDFSDNLDPVFGGSFLLDPRAFDEEGRPLSHFAAASISAGLVEAGPGDFIVELPLLGGAPVRAVMQGTLIEARVSAVAERPYVSLADGRLGGYFHEKMLFDAANAYVWMSCSCLGLGNDPLMDYATHTCASDGSPEQCTSEEEEVCGQLYYYCPMMMPFISMVLDVDADGDGAYDSISVGLTFSGIPALIEGVVE